MDSQTETRFSLLNEYEERAEELVEVRRRYSKKIEDYLSKTTKVELANLKKITYKELKTTTPKMKFDFKVIPECIKHYEIPKFLEEQDQHNLAAIEKVKILMRSNGCQVD